MSNEKLTLIMALIASVLSALIIFCERAFPFVLFSKKEPPAVIRFIEKYIPPMVMAALLFYCLKNIDFAYYAHTASENLDKQSNFVPQLSALSVTCGLHLWKRNSLISIFGGTIVYMVMINFL